MYWQYWIISAVILVIIEILSPGVFFFACLGLGSLTAGLVELLNPPFWVPWLIFLITSIVSIYFVRPVAKKYFQPIKTEKTNVDALIGGKALVVEGINPPEFGTVKIDGELWRAESEEAVEAKKFVKITAVKGSHLEVKEITGS
jgi:membrane protein implicated in regulation of membrane protease activity